MRAVNLALIPARPAEHSGSADPWARLKSLVLASVTSPHSRRAYLKALVDFEGWTRTAEITAFSKGVVQEYRAHLEASGLAPSSINVRLSAIKKLATEAADNGIIPQDLAAAVGRVKGARHRGVRTGNWLTKAQAERAFELPDRSTNKGKRDRALVCLLIGCGLRREELALLDLNRIQQREGRWALVDIVGKGKRVRTVPMPTWAKAAVDEWTAAAGISEGRLLRPVNKGDRVYGDRMTAQAIFAIIKGYGVKLGVEISPHDLRRTFAKLAHTGQAPIEQIQITLGHASIQTTERYLGVRQDLTDAPCDHLGLKV